MRILKCVKGITLTELVVVMAVMSVLASVAMPILRVSVKRSKEITLRRELRTMRDGIDYYKKLSDEGRITREAGGTGYPKTLDDLTKIISITNVTPLPGAASAAPLPTKIRILRKIPVDPMTGDTEWGKRSNEDEPDSTIWGGQDVFDVYCLSEETALDGTKYKDW
jgi:general secretion pathway protein G